jgi:hypothetical protein
MPDPVSVVVPAWGLREQHGILRVVLAHLFSLQGSMHSPPLDKLVKEAVQEC